jgi:hypothetical protein
VRQVDVDERGAFTAERLECAFVRTPHLVVDALADECAWNANANVVHASGE